MAGFFYVHRLDTDKQRMYNDGMRNINKTRFVDLVMMRLLITKNITSEHDIDHLKFVARMCYDNGFKVKEAVAYCKCTEEYNPELPEDIALDRMREIEQNVNGPKRI